MENCLKLVSIILMTAVLSGCVGTKAGAYKIFAEDLERLVGTPFNDAYVYVGGHLKDKVPVEIKHLSNGNEIRIYDFTKNPLSLVTWRRTKETCKIYIEVDSKTKLITSASYSGIGCYRAY